MSTSTTAELVESVLNSMRSAAEAGETGALDTLAKHSSREGKAPAEEAAPKAPAAAPTGLSAGVPRVTRPNGEEYVVRKLGIHDDVAVLRNARENNLFTLLYGPPGTGKTALIEAAYAEPKGGGLYTIQGSGDTEVADFVGGFVQLPGGEFEWVDGPLLLAMETGGVLYIDEIALIDPKVMAIVYGVMDGRDELRITQNPERGVVKARDGFYVAGACNPNAPGARMSEALLSRFAMMFEVTTDYALAKKLGVPAKVVTASMNADRKLQEGAIGWAPQLRELLNYVKVERVFGQKVALENLVSAAPEMDRDQIKDVLSRAFGEPVGELRLK